jgi:hypothetical protein
MGLFGKGSSSSGKDASGSKGKPNQGYGKGSAATNSKKWTERTEAQAKRSENSVKNWKG